MKNNTAITNYFDLPHQHAYQRAQTSTAQPQHHQAISPLPSNSHIFEKKDNQKAIQSSSKRLY